jgi:RimJ/RimL family protein N-acetyltransferase
VALLCAWAFEGLGLRRLHLMVDLDNDASHAVARACGFVPVGEVFWEHPVDPGKSGWCVRYEHGGGWEEAAGLARQ